MLPCSRIASASFSLGLDPPKDCRTRPRAPDFMFAAHREQERASLPPWDPAAFPAATCQWWGGPGRSDGFGRSSERFLLMLS